MRKLLLPCWLRAVSAIVLVTIAVPWPGFSQSTGTIRGRVVDDQGEPVDGARVVFAFQGAETRRLETTTNRAGEFFQLDLSSGHYRITADKGELGGRAFQVRVQPGQTVEVNFLLERGVGPAPWEEDPEGGKLLTSAFAAGVAANRARRYDEAIDKFNEVVRLMPSCADCHYNIGIAYTRQKEYGRAEAAFKRALEVKPDFATAYYGLAEVYRAQQRLDDAAAARAQATTLAIQTLAAGRARAHNIFNQGLIFWNAGNISDAKQRFEAALKLDPRHAEAHYWLGMANASQGRIPEAVSQLEVYLKLDPDGRYVEEAKETLGRIR